MLRVLREVGAYMTGNGRGQPDRNGVPNLPRDLGLGPTPEEVLGKVLQ